MLLLKTPLKFLMWLWNAEMSVLEWRHGKMVTFMKNAQCPSTMATNPTLCDHIYHIWEKGLVM